MKRNSNDGDSPDSPVHSYFQQQTSEVVPSQFSESKQMTTTYLGIVYDLLKTKTDWTACWTGKNEWIDCIIKKLRKKSSEQKKI